jgi:hypothetical protein
LEFAAAGDAGAAGLLDGSGDGDGAGVGAGVADPEPVVVLPLPDEFVAAGCDPEAG